MQTSNHFNSPPKLIQYLETRTSRGMLSKGWYEQDGRLLLVKGNGDVGGYEPQSEVLVSNLLHLMKIPHVTYWLDDASKYPDIKTFGGNQPVSVCESFLTDDVVETMTFCNFIDAKAKARGVYNVRDYWQELQRLPEKIKQDVYLMLHVDAIVGNLDRHLNNWDILRMHDGTLKLAPLFDFGASLLAWESVAYSDFSRGVSPDRAKPFTELHSKQVRLISREYSNTLHVDLEQWKAMSEDVLCTLGEQRSLAICNYLRNRLGVYGRV